MEKFHNLERLKTMYLQEYEDAFRSGKHKLDPYLEDWRETLNEIEFKFYSDIKSIGVFLYPYYPVNKIFADFANPFEQIAVIIRYKKSDENTIREKSSYLKKCGWIVYIMESKAVTYSAEDLFKRKYPNSTMNLTELEPDDFLNFVNRYSTINSECLLYSIKAKHFE